MTPATPDTIKMPAGSFTDSACCSHLREEIQDNNCWQTLATAAHFGCEELCKQTLTYIQIRPSETHTSLPALPKDTLVNVLQSKAVDFGSESDAIQGCELPPSSQVIPRKLSLHV
ncbi:hypothetical protein WJX72_010544 [[Myrmecia] bisecta]|uniref:Uncharacterized protein n=1 Tax=[Myrmecia] bisecta TaxID=41462 RepID=A0AAW1PQR4_9CHLO